MAEINYRKGQFARFFRAVKGRLVSRPGTARYTQVKRGGPIHFRAASTIGGRRPPLPPQDNRDPQVDPLGAMPIAPIVQDLQKITAISHDEARKHKRLYDKWVRNGDLEEVNEAAYIAYLKADAERAEADRKRREELAKNKAKAEKAEADATTAAASKRAKKDDQKD